MIPFEKIPDETFAAGVLGRGVGIEPAEGIVAVPFDGEIYTNIYEKLSTLQWLMKRRQMVGQAESGPFADSTRGQGRVLAMLKIQPEITTKDLSYLLGIRQQSLNELLNKLEKSGYVERRPSETDRRVMVVHLTEQGKTVEQPAADYQRILGCLSEEELRQFGNYLDRIIAAFPAQEGVDAPSDYDGPVPDRRDFDGFGGRERK